MVGDSIRNDVAGAQAVGAMGILVRTGGFRPDQLTRSPNRPDLLVESVAALPDLLL
jgi:ribonucleotide monophosphatase NagD (HAD superfamily)